MHSLSKVIAMSQFNVDSVVGSCKNIIRNLEHAVSQFEFSIILHKHTVWVVQGKKALK